MRADLVAGLGSWLLTYLLHSTLLLGLAWLLTRRWVHASAVRDIIWKAALVGGIVTATLQAGLAYEPLGGAMAVRMRDPATRKLTDSARPPTSEWSGTLMRPGSTEPDGRERAGGAVPATAAPLPEVSAPAVSRSASPGIDGPGVSSWLLPVAVGGWALLAVALVGLYLIQRNRAMRRIGPRLAVIDARLQAMLDGLRQAGGVRPLIRLTSAPGLASPVALGRDEIVLPHAALTELSPEQQRSMLAHELAHLGRRDPAWLALSCLLERMFFIQPLNRLARVRLQEAAEYLCDDWAVTRTGSGVSLATCLVKVAEWVSVPAHPVPLAGMAEHRSQLVTRIHRLIEGRTMPTAPRSLWFLAGAVALVGFTAVAAPGITASSEAVQAQDTTRGSVAAADSDTVESSTHRMLRLMHLTESRARRDARRALLDVQRMTRTAAIPPQPAIPAMAPMPPRAPRLFGATPMPALAPLAPRLAELRAQVAWLGRDGRQRDTTSIAVPALIAALKDGDVEVRRAAVQSLSNLDDPRAVPAFIDALRDADAEVRASAANGLGQFEDKRAIAPLVALLKDTDKDVRRAAMSALSRQSAEVPADMVVAALADKDPEIRQAALNLAQRHNDGDEDQPWDPRIVQAVLGLIGDPNADVRGEAISLVGDMRLTQAPAGLLSAAKDKNPDVRQQVASALGQIRDPKAVATLREMLNDGNADVREQAVQALGEIRDRSSLEALVGALKSSDPVVRRNAAQALGQREEEN